MLPALATTSLRQSGSLDFDSVLRFERIVPPLLHGEEINEPWVVSEINEIGVTLEQRITVESLGHGFAKPLECGIFFVHEGVGASYVVLGVMEVAQAAMPSDSPH